MKYLKMRRSKIVSIRCFRCNGTGRIVYTDKTNKLSSYRKVICPRCGGTGKAPKI